MIYLHPKIMKITAAITTYNRFEYAKRAIKSVLSQTYSPFEIIVVEDGSDSGIGTFLEKQHPDIIYINHKTNAGLAAARNTVLHKSKGDWIAYLDDDDEWMPQRLYSQVEYFYNTPPDKRSDIACIQVGSQLKAPNGDVICKNLPKNEGLLSTSIKSYGAVTPSSSFLFEKSSLKAVGGFDETIGSGIDHDIWMKMAVAGYENRCVQKVQVNIYRDSRATMMTDAKKRILGLLAYSRKWNKTYAEWYGCRTGRDKMCRYFTKVIGTLAAEKLSQGDLKHFVIALHAISRFSGFRPLFLTHTYLKILKHAVFFKCLDIKYSSPAPV